MKKRMSEDKTKLLLFSLLYTFGSFVVFSPLLPQSLHISLCSR